MSEFEIYDNMTNYILTGTNRKKLWDKADETVRRNFELNPHHFNTATLSIPYEMRYIPPFETEFKELKHLQLKASLTASLFHEYQGYIILDLTQYAGHETDYYFDISLKFLRDMAGDWAYIFIVNRESASCRPMIEKIAVLFCDLPLLCWSTDNEDENETQIKRILNDCQTVCSDKTSHVLQSILDKRVLSPAQMAILIKETLKDYSRLSCRTMEQYLNSPDSILKVILPANRHDELITDLKNNQTEYEHTKTI